jgi:hypothetical protein
MYYSYVYGNFNGLALCVWRLSWIARMCMERYSRKCVTCHSNETSDTKFLSIVFIDFSYDIFFLMISLESNVYLLVCSLHIFTI